MVTAEPKPVVVARPYESTREAAMAAFAESWRRESTGIPPQPGHFFGAAQPPRCGKARE